MKSSRLFFLILLSVATAAAQNSTELLGHIFQTGLAAQLAQSATTTVSYTVAHFPYGDGWSTRVMLVNSGSADATANITFFNQAGAPTLVPLEGQTGSQGSQEILVHPNSTEVVGAQLSQRIGGTLQTAWATVTSTAPLNVLSLFDFGRSASVIDGAVGAQATAPAQSFRFPISVGGPLQYNFGLAVANPNATQTTFTVKVLNADGSAKGSFQENLPPNGQSLFTLPSKIPFDTSTLFNGSVAVCASQPVGLVTVGFEGGAFFSASVTNDPCP